MREQCTPPPGGGLQLLIHSVLAFLSIEYPLCPIANAATSAFACGIDSAVLDGLSICTSMRYVVGWVVVL